MASGRARRGRRAAWPRRRRRRARPRAGPRSADAGAWSRRGPRGSPARTRPARVRRRACESSPYRVVSGERSSCAALAMKRCCRADEEAEAVDHRVDVLRELHDLGVAALHVGSGRRGRRRRRAGRPAIVRWPRVSRQTTTTATSTVHSSGQPNTVAIARAGSARRRRGRCAARPAAGARRGARGRRRGPRAGARRRPQVEADVACVGQGGERGGAPRHDGVCARTSPLSARRARRTWSAGRRRWPRGRAVADRELVAAERSRPRRPPRGPRAQERAGRAGAPGWRTSRSGPAANAPPSVNRVIAEMART
jgi:hypothetical protein